MDFPKRFLALGLACVFPILFAGCDRSASDGDIFRVGNGTEPEGLDPHIVTGVPEHHILLSLFEGLVRLDPEDLRPIPGVAETWEVSEDSLTYTFHLRPDAKWSNGAPLDAHDFAYAWRRILTPALASEYAYMLYPIRNAQAYNKGAIDDFSQVGARVIDDHTLEVTLEQPTPYFFALQAHYSWFPVHQETIEKFGAMEDRTSKWTRAGNLVGNGPYVLSRWVPNSVIEVRPNPNYWDYEGIRNDGVNYYPVTDEQTEERMFRAGELHVTENVPSPKVTDYLENRPQLIRIDPWIGTYFYRLNTTRPPLDDIRVRKALAMTIDRNAITNTIMRAGETPAHFLTPPNVDGFTAKAHVPYDIEQAQKLLAEAGYPQGEGFPTIDILYNTMERHQNIAEAIQQMWKRDLGINVTLTNQEWKVYLSSTSNERLDFDIARAGWIGDVEDAINFLECFISDNGNNRTGWGNDEYDDVLARVYKEVDKAQRHRYYQEAEAILMDELPIIPIYHYTRPILIQPEVRDYHSNILAYTAYHKVWLDKSESGE